MTRGRETKEAILKAALDFSSKLGLENLSIGELAKKVGMSKSGLFGHFNSKEKLQITVLDYAAKNFTENVFLPAFKVPRGVPRIRAIVNNWHNWSGQFFTGGCPFVAAAFEFDDRPGAIRDRIIFHQQTMIDSFAKAATIAIEEKHFRNDVDPKQFAYEFYSLLLGHHLFNRLLKSQDAKDRFNLAFDNLIQLSEIK